MSPDVCPALPVDSSLVSTHGFGHRSSLQEAWGKGMSESTNRGHGSLASQSNSRRVSSLSPCRKHLSPVPPGAPRVANSLMLNEGVHEKTLVQIGTSHPF